MANLLAKVITEQPTYNAVDDTAKVDVEAEKLKEEKEKEKEKKKDTSSYIDPDCCCLLEEDDFLFQYLCCRMITNFIVDCAQCTERCCKSCCSCLRNPPGPGDNSGFVVVQETDSGCYNNNCCDCDCDDCCCGDCDCDC